jgi:hypothetical protein
LEARCARILFDPLAAQLGRYTATIPSMTQAITREVLSARIDATLADLFPTPPAENGYRKPGNVQGAVQTTLTILALIYGSESPQLDQFRDRLKKGHGRWDNEVAQWGYRVGQEIEHVLPSALADFDSGITGSVRVQAKGEVLGDFLALAREALSNGGLAEKVAAVLVAAAMEETLKQIGEKNGVDVYNRDMRGVIQKLKDAGVLSGAQPGVATGYVKFRDNAFHGQFDAIERGTTESAAMFVEGLLTTRFS